MILGIIASQVSEIKTNAPAIFDASASTYRYTVRNDDPAAAIIYSDHNQSNPTTSRGSIASGSSTSTINTLEAKFLGSSITIYAKAQASGKTMSDVTSLYLET